MKMRNYLKKKNERVDAVISDTACAVFRITGRRKILFSGAVILLILPVLLIYAVHREFDNITPINQEMVQLTSSPIAEASGKKGVIAIPAGTVKANPFLPYRDISGTSTNVVGDVPAFNLVEPPEIVNENSDAARVMDTIVSGILYDKYSPSAILNIEGNDYLVKKGDVVNNYKIVSIMQDAVTVKLGTNVYKAGIGEILTEGEMNHNEVSNLNKKFGGEK